MSQAGKGDKIIKRIVLVICLLCILSVGAAVYAAYLNTNRDTRKAPERAVSDLKVTNDYVLLYESDSYQYFFREDRDVIAVKDKKSGYVWKTGLDVPFSKDIKNAKEAVEDAKASNDNSILERYAKDEDMTVDEVKKLAETPVEDSLNDQYTAMANSLITVAYYTGEGKSMSTTRVSSAAEKPKDGKSSIEKSKDDGSEWVLKCVFKLDDEELGVNVYITFGDDGSINYKVPYEEFSGEALYKVSDIEITPFMGASGGTSAYYNEKTEKWDKLEGKYLTPGYVFVPDGSGSLIRFTNNKSKFQEYEGVVYGKNPATDMYYYSWLTDAVPIKEPVMPVFGISQGDGTQTAFVAYADGGDEYMSIVAAPSSMEKNQIKYTYAYPKFKYNAEFYQVTNQAGDSYRKTQDDTNEFDIDLTYEFLSGDGTDGTPSADYVGMAQVYRKHLIENGTLTEITSDSKYIPIRLDFVMADSKNGVFSTQEVDVTTADDVKNILNAFIDTGITNINSGLIGWQKGGESLSKPYKAKFSSGIGNKSDFENLMSEFAEKNVDISFSREFATINKTMIGYYGNAAKHLNTQYLTIDKGAVVHKNAPVKDFGYAAPNKVAEWITDLYDSVGDLSQSFTIDGASNLLISNYENDGDNTTPTETIELYQNALKSIGEDDTKLNLVSPNQYLWKYTDRYLQSPVGTSQYVYETDTVPFLQMVLHGTMEVYAPYSNFSFYSQSDMLKMIDYNISPSFVLTQEPSYLLASTLSADYYSTEFTQYEDIVKNIYETVNGTLSQVINYKWDSRKVINDGVIANTYSKDGNVKTVIINYTEDEVTVSNTKIAPLSSQVIEGGVQ